MKNNRILWIEDDSYNIKGLIRSLQNEGFQFDIAESAVEAYQKAQIWESYDLIIVDMILPLCNNRSQIPTIVESWTVEQHLGIGIVKWLKVELKAKCPIIIMSIIENPISRFKIGDLEIAGVINKRGLLPSTLKNEVLHVLKKNDIT